MPKKHRLQKAANLDTGSVADFNGMDPSTPTLDGFPLGLLPRELLLTLVDAAPFPLQVYCQLIGLTHGIRMAIRGAPRELSFQCPVPISADPRHPTRVDEHCLAPCLPADALAAIVGPCKGLVRLTLPTHNRRHPSVLGCGLPLDEHDKPGGTTWVDEAFGGHTQLAYLEIPGAGTLATAIRRILSHLPGLEEFHFLHARPSSACSKRWPPAAPSCACCISQHDGSSPDRILWPSSPSPAPSRSSSSLACRWAAGCLVVSSPNCTLWSDSRWTVATWGCCAPLPRISSISPRTEIPRSGFGAWTRVSAAWNLALESFTSETEPDEKIFAPVMTACRDTLRSLSLTAQFGICPGHGLLAALGALTHLIRLKLSLLDKRATLAIILAALPPGLLENRLVSLSLELSSDKDDASAYQLNSRSLRQLDLGLHLPGSCTLTLACPALDRLALPFVVGGSRPYALVMNCPHLHSLERLHGQQNLGHSTPMPELVEASGLYCEQRLDPTWMPQLMALSPRLRVMSGLLVSHAMLSQLCAGCPSLMTLRSIRLRTKKSAYRQQVKNVAATTDSPAFPLRLPEQLEVMDGQITVEGPQGPLELRLEAPGLRVLRLDVPPQMRLTLACPDLVALDLTGGSSFALAEGLDPPLRSLCLGCANVPGKMDHPITDSLLPVLTRHGSHLQCVSLSSKRLIPSTDVVLACPRLSRLTIRPPIGAEFGLRLRSLVLNCPQLEELKAPFDRHLERSVEFFSLLSPQDLSPDRGAVQKFKSNSGCENPRAPLTDLLPFEFVSLVT
ncbi:hypothetical protein PAPYR_8950 [Paratrimastix pyriformis]|uniref:Uncharacterized protein n=1 Tax=Paratrimastix pyriformis TaxID=342808 RepID=A0ABQ8UDP9_9EUKA|nr:hypothetical protein PAPYR_8950 [Paratrimastix pyriformis]